MLRFANVILFFLNYTYFYNEKDNFAVTFNKKDFLSLDLCGKSIKKQPWF